MGALKAEGQFPETTLRPILGGLYRMGLHQKNGFHRRAQTNIPNKVAHFVQPIELPTLTRPARPKAIQLRSNPDGPYAVIQTMNQNLNLSDLCI
jgi:hypothetical protein